MVNLGHGNWILSSRITRTPYRLAITTVKSETKNLGGEPMGRIDARCCEVNVM